MLKRVQDARFALLAVLLAAAAVLAAPQQRSQVWLVELDGPVGPAVADLIIRSIGNAEDAGAAALVIRMDTPGGLDKSMRAIIKAILASDVPVITYVAPNGARAASAGTYIAFASHLIAMAPASNIGSSTPVSLGGESSPTPGSPSGGNKNGQGGDGAVGPGGNNAAAARGGGGEGQPSQAAESTDAMTRKIMNDAVAYLQSLAELRGRNIEWAEQTVRYGANLRASEALKMNVIDLIAPDLQSVLQQADGTTVNVASGPVTLRVAGAGIRRVETDWRHEVLEIITDPTIAYGLLIFGIYGLILEFYSPGMLFPAVIGTISLLLGAYGLQMLPINYAGVALIVLGIGLMVAEAFTPTVGIMGIAGVVSFVIGSLIMMDTDVSGYQLPYLVIGAFATAAAGLSVLAVGAAVRARQQKIVTGHEGMLHGTAEAMEDFAETGWVWAFGERWKARTDVPVKKGDTLRIEEIDGLTLVVTAES